MPTKSEGLASKGNFISLASKVLEELFQFGMDVAADYYANQRAWDAYSQWFEETYGYKPNDSWQKEFNRQLLEWYRQNADQFKDRPPPQGYDSWEAYFTSPMLYDEWMRTYPGGPEAHYGITPDEVAGGYYDAIGYKDDMWHKMVMFELYGLNTPTTPPTDDEWRDAEDRLARKLREIERRQNPRTNIEYTAPYRPGFIDRAGADPFDANAPTWRRQLRTLTLGPRY